MTGDGSAKDRRKVILAAAEKVFDASGYAGATMDAVARQAGLAKGSLYNYFENKQDLFVQVFIEAMRGELEQTDQRLSGELSAGRKLEGMIEAWFSRVGYYKRIGRLVLESWAAAAREDRQGRLATIFQEIHRVWRDRLVGIIEQGMAGGEFDPGTNALAMATLVMATGNGATMQSILSVGARIDERFLTAFKRAMLAGLSRAGGEAGKAEVPSP